MGILSHRGMLKTETIPDEDQLWLMHLFDPVRIESFDLVEIEVCLICRRARSFDLLETEIFDLLESEILRSTGD